MQGKEGGEVGGKTVRKRFRYNESKDWISLLEKNKTSE